MLLPFTETGAPRTLAHKKKIGEVVRYLVGNKGGDLAGEVVKALTELAGT